MSSPVSHDQNFKNLILDYPRAALAFFAPQEAGDLDDSVRITPIRQEQLKDRLGDRFFELDVPLLVEWPDGRREALLFVLEEESDPSRFSIHRLGHYCLDLAEMFKTDRVVPIVIFLRPGTRGRRELELGSERHTHLYFDYIACTLAYLPVEAHLDSRNIVARITLPLMRWAHEQKIDVYAHAVSGLALEPNEDKRLKYMDFVDAYIQLDENERLAYSERYPQEHDTMATWTERMRDEGRRQGVQQGIQQGLQRGESTVVSRQLARRFGPLEPAVIERLNKASSAELEQWADNLLDASTLEEVFRPH